VLSGTQATSSSENSSAIAVAREKHMRRMEDLLIVMNGNAR
jgi:hypothetical protein